MKRGTPDHPKTVMLTMELEKVYAAHRKRSSFGGKAEAVGILEVLWDWCSKYAIQGDLGKWPDDVIARGIGWIWSGKELISCLIESRWIDRAPEPYRLVLHDIRDHATNTWRQNLEDAGLNWWDGSSPRKYKLQKSQEKLQNTSRKSPQPEPETQPEPKPEPQREAGLAFTVPPPPTPDLSGIATEIWQRHPGHRRGTRQSAERDLAIRCAGAVDAWAVANAINRTHIECCESEQWRSGKAMGLTRWLTEDGPGTCMSEPPPREELARQKSFSELRQEQTRQKFIAGLDWENRRG